jgi:amidophosphoribosyltransferase
MRLHAYLGLVAQVFDEPMLATLRGVQARAAVGHTRYSTTGSNKSCNTQPILVADGALGELALAHNGNITNALALREELLAAGVRFEGTTDSEVAAHLLAGTPGGDWVARLRTVMGRLEGAYSLVLLGRDAIYGARDPFGIRPLCLGRLPDGGWVITSETCALQTVGAKFVREVAPGEIVQIDADGLTTWQTAPGHAHALCLFEYIYFARPDSTLNGRSLYLARQAMGRILAAEHPAEADIVIGVPDSAIPAAIGYAAAAGLPYTEGLVKNRYIGRTFIQPDQRLRARGVALKFNPLPEVLQGQRVVVVDDSIVRGTTTPPIVHLLREAGAREVHLRIHSPAIPHPCFLGVDLARREELIAHNMSVPEICAAVGADSLGFLSLPGLLRAVAQGREHFCAGCFTGAYPVHVDLAADLKLALEANRPVTGESPLPVHAGDRLELTAVNR